MKFKHREKGYVINVHSRRGRVVVSRDRFVTTSGIGYKGFNMFPEDTLYDKFKEVKDAD